MNSAGGRIDFDEFSFIDVGVNFGAFDDRKAQVHGIAEKMRANPPATTARIPNAFNTGSGRGVYA